MYYDVLKYIEINSITNFINNKKNYYLKFVSIARKRQLYQKILEKCRKINSQLF